MLTGYARGPGACHGCTAGCPGGGSALNLALTKVSLQVEKDLQVFLTVEHSETAVEEWAVFRYARGVGPCGVVNLELVGARMAQCLEWIDCSWSFWIHPYSVWCCARWAGGSFVILEHQGLINPHTPICSLLHPACKCAGSS